ncbi:MmcB family DNA repair protein [Magnetovibrio sp. PR-2]|uniref:MmcB family DNA repair protein n=1 Tax=Magnetovibrio sp. PR-2 TaxID=3120356 RepID=UPI002FCE493B
MTETLTAQDISRGVLRMLATQGYRGVTELPLTNNRRCDIAALGPRGEVVIVEIKSSRNDFQSDTKWPEYVDHCERFFFAVAPDFPVELLPIEQGLIISDGYSADIIRDVEPRKLAPARRKSITLRIARTAAHRLHAELDPAFDQSKSPI